MVWRARRQWKSKAPELSDYKKVTENLLPSSPTGSNDVRRGREGESCAANILLCENVILWSFDGNVCYDKKNENKVFERSKRWWMLEEYSLCVHCGYARDDEAVNTSCGRAWDGIHSSWLSIGLCGWDGNYSFRVPSGEGGERTWICDPIELTSDDVRISWLSTLKSNVVNSFEVLNNSWIIECQP